MNDIKELDPENVSIFGDDTERFLLKLWEEEQGMDSVKFARLAPYFMRFSPRLEDGLAPQVLSCGQHTLTAQLVGPAVANQPPDVINEALGDSYRRFASSIYHDATLNREPKYDQVYSIFSTAGRSYELLYTRLVLPVTNQLGHTQTLLYAKDSHNQLIHRQPDPQDHHDDSRPTRDRSLSNRQQAVLST